MREKKTRKKGTVTIKQSRKHTHTKTFLFSHFLFLTFLPSNFIRLQYFELWQNTNFVSIKHHNEYKLNSLLCTSFTISSVLSVLRIYSYQQQFAFIFFCFVGVLCSEAASILSHPRENQKEENRQTSK